MHGAKAQECPYHHAPPYPVKTPPPIPPMRLTAPSSILHDKAHATRSLKPDSAVEKDDVRVSQGTHDGDLGHEILDSLCILLFPERLAGCDLHLLHGNSLSLIVRKTNDTKGTLADDRVLTLLKLDILIHDLLRLYLDIELFLYILELVLKELGLLGIRSL